MRRQETRIRMKKKGISSLVFIIPAAIATFVIAGVFLYKLYGDQTATRAKATETPKEKIQLQENKKKPQSGYGAVTGPTAVPTATPIYLSPGNILAEPEGVNELNAALDAQVEDDGTKDLESAEGLSGQL